ncbi:MAG: hypothetical protein ABSH17_02755 [Syntrophobacteraceae bacterium]
MEAGAIVAAPLQIASWSVPGPELDAPERFICGRIKLTNEGLLLEGPGTT